MANPTYLSRINTAIKAARMAFSGANPSGGWQGGTGVIPVDDQFTFARAIRAYRDTIDYAKEVGDVSRSSLVMSAVNWVGRTLPEAPVRVVEDDEAGGVQPIASHPASALLRRPNPDYSGATMQKASALSWILSGNIYWLKQRGVRGQVVRLYWWPHWQIRPIRAVAGDYISYYEIAVDGVWKRWDREDVIHFRDGIHPDNDMLGFGPLNALLREIFTDNEVTDYQASVTKNGGVIPFVLAPKGADVEVNTERIKEEVMRRTTGKERGKPLVLTSGVDLHKMGITPAEMAIDQVRHVPEERLAAVIGIPGMVLGFGSALQRSTFSNYRQAQEAAYETYMVPLWRYIDDELTHQLLLPDYGAKEGERIERDLSGVRALQEDEDAKHKRITMDYQAGIITRAEARGALGFDVDESRDDVFLMKSGTAIVPRDMEAIDPTTQPEPQPVDPQAQDIPVDQSGDPMPQDASQKVLPDEYKSTGFHSYSTTQINLPDAIGQKMFAFAASIPNQDLAGDGIEDQPHITVKYGLETQRTGDIQNLFFIGNVRPFTIEFGDTDYFTSSDFDVVYVSVKSRELKRLHKLISQLPNVSTHPTYTPHATIAYVNPGEGRKYAGKNFLRGASLVVDRMTFSGKDGTQIIIPFE